ncbi:hypothetical protein BASA81_002276 [Batrachochytrium salamandrivorans]|nr:hypothetical protein BASA81_002276 [Batrachochytrium salamandrivorans]
MKATKSEKEGKRVKMEEPGGYRNRAAERRLNGELSLEETKRQMEQELQLVSKDGIITNANQLPPLPIEKSTTDKPAQKPDEYQLPSADMELIQSIRFDKIHRAAPFSSSLLVVAGGGDEEDEETFSKQVQSSSSSEDDEDDFDMFATTDTTVPIESLSTAELQGLLIKVDQALELKLQQNST